MGGYVTGFKARFSPVMIIHLPDKAINNMTFIISNSKFVLMQQPIISIIYIGTYATNTQIWIVNCTFAENSYTSTKRHGIWFSPMININLLQYNMTIRLINCDFLNNVILELILIDVVDSDYHGIPVSTSCAFSSKISVTSCNFIENRGNLLKLQSYQLPHCRHFVFI